MRRAHASAAPRLAELATPSAGQVAAGAQGQELSDVGSAQYSQMESALRVLIMHMLKWDQQPEKRTPSWIYAIREQRLRYAKILRKNPGLKPHLNTMWDEIYTISRNWAADECHLPPGEFPPECPFTWDDLLERPFDLDSMKT